MSNRSRFAQLLVDVRSVGRTYPGAAAVLVLGGVIVGRLLAAIF
jgi:hypothetical protein